MITIGIIREGKTPPDNRVPLTPSQCKWIRSHFPGVQVKVQSAPTRCFSDAEYRRAGIEVVADLTDADILLGIKEVPVEALIPGKTYLFFSHTKKKQPHNQKLLQAVLKNKIRLIDYECLLHDDGQRIIGFGFFAGIVGAHNGMMVYGNRTGTFSLGRVHQHKTFRKLMHTYFGLLLPNVKTVVTGSGRVAQGALEIMNLMQVRQVEPEEFLEREFSYPVYVHLKGSDLYRRKDGGAYHRQDFHQQPSEYESCFRRYAFAADILMNGVYWDQFVPRLFEREAVQEPGFRLQVIADITDDTNGSVPINLGDQPIEDPVYGVDKQSLERTAPYLPTSVDIMAVGNLPNELPRDASRYFGEQLIKYVLPDLLRGTSTVLQRATIAEGGGLTEPYTYLSDYAAGV
ncbi:NAD(P)-dependent oxidoreductase [Flaviaesturariibacter amylovorans]|uniref:Saccharopine dehydrogenase [NAD(+), L-lysine-forming] n=1 Tax=Flaviaesturariibacter amylovorans TaxID=1084520 RepID=A0ABP8GR02_9BACT